jgi:hypothetical protein
MALGLDLGASGQCNAHAGNYTLNLWAGSPGYAVDRIVITTYSWSFPSEITRPTLHLTETAPAGPVIPATRALAVTLTGWAALQPMAQ